MTAKITQLPEDERPISEQFRIAARQWVEAEKAASLLEETKSATLSQMMLRQGDMPVSRAEMNVKASEDWRAFIESMVEARSDANLCKVKLEWLRILERERDRDEWHQRSERKMMRTTT